MIVLMVLCRPFSVATFLKTLLSSRFIIIIIIIIIINNNMFSHLCRVFIIIYMRQTVFLRCIILLMFCIYILCTSNVTSHVKYVLYSYINTLRIMCAVPSMTVVCSSFIIVIIIIIIIITTLFSSCCGTNWASYQATCSTEHSSCLMPRLRMPWNMTYLHFLIRFHVTTTNYAHRQLYPHCIDYS